MGDYHVKEVATGDILVLVEGGGDTILCWQGVDDWDYAPYTMTKEEAEHALRVRIGSGWRADQLSIERREPPIVLEV